MTVAKKSKSNPKTPVEKQFFEIVNWRRAQPTMPAGPNVWMKLYTSLLEHDGFCGMDDSARMLIVALWLYAARCGQHIFPSDPAWLARKIPMLNSKPDLRPLLDAKDICGNPTPFISYCEPLEAKEAKEASEAKKTSTPAKKKKKKKKKIVVLKEEKREEKKRKEKTREEKKRKEKTKPLRVSGEKNKERKERIRTAAAQQTASAPQAEAVEPEKPENPMNSEAGSAKRHIMPKPARSAIRHSSPRSIGSILSERFPDHWQDPDAESFGWEIVRALGYPDDPHNMKNRSEWGAFAAWWSRVKKSAPAIVLDELRAKAIRKAVYLRTKGKSAKNPSKVWFFIMNGELSQRGVTISQPARASPLR